MPLDRLGCSHPNVRAVAKFFARLGIGQMHFYHWHGDRADRVEQRDGSVGVSPCIEQNGLIALRICLMQPVDQHPLVIGLAHVDF